MTATAITQVIPAAKAATNTARAEHAASNAETGALENEDGKTFKTVYNDARDKTGTHETTTDNQVTASENKQKEAVDESGNDLPQEAAKGETAANDDRSDSNRALQHGDESVNPETSQSSLLGSLGSETQQIEGLADADSENNGTEFASLALADGVKVVETQSSPGKPALADGVRTDRQTITGSQSAFNDLTSAVATTDVSAEMPPEEAPEVMELAENRISKNKPLTLLDNDTAGKNADLSVKPRSMDTLSTGQLNQVMDKLIPGEKIALETIMAKLESANTAVASEHKMVTALPLSTAQNYFSVSSTTTTGLYQAVISEGIDQPGWNQSMSKQVAWMASQNIRSAEVRLTPANLGTIEVRIDMDDDKVNVGFSSRHLGVRDAVEQAMPRLREMMEEQGLNLGESSVSEQALFEHQGESFSQQSYSSINTPSGLESAADLSTVNGEAGVLPERRSAETMVDYYI